MNDLIKIRSKSDIPPELWNTPPGLLLEYHNLKRSFDQFEDAKLLVGMCMDNRKSLVMPPNFAYVVRTGGGNLMYNEFHISYAISIARISYMVIIGHTQCGMVRLVERKQAFINGLVNIAGWNHQKAEEHFERNNQKFEIGNEIEFTLFQTAEFSERYPEITVIPMLYKVEDNLLYLIDQGG